MGKTIVNNSILLKPNGMLENSSVGLSVTAVPIGSSPTLPTRGYLTGGTSGSILSVFVALANANDDGKANLNIDGTAYADAALSVRKIDTDLFNALTRWSITGTAVIDSGRAKVGSAGNQSNTISMTVGYPSNVVRTFNFKQASLPRSTGSTHNLGLTNFYFYNDYSGTATIKIADVGTSGIDTGIAAGDTLHDFKIVLTADSKANFYIDGNLVRAATNSTGDTQYPTLHTYDGGKYMYCSELEIWAPPVDMAAIATNLTTAVRAVTGGNETVVYSTDHFVVYSGAAGTASAILRFTTPSSGTDISGNGATKYLDLGTGATETAGTGSELLLATTGDDGQISPIISSSRKYVAASAIALLDAVYVAATTGKIAKTNTTSNDALANNFVGFALQSASGLDELVLVQYGGIVSGFTGLTIGSTYYLTNTPGVIGTSAGSQSRKVGIAVSSTELLIKLDNA